MKKRFKQLASLPTVTWLLALAMLIVWGGGMCCLTAVTAEYAASRDLADYSDFASTLAGMHYYGFDRGSPSHSDDYLSHFWVAAHQGGMANGFLWLNPWVTRDDQFLPRPEQDNVYSATAIYDADGNPLVCSWEDYFYFSYLTEEQWQNGEERPSGDARALFDRDRLTEAGEALVARGFISFQAAALRFTGTLDGVELTPQKIEYIDRGDYRAVTGSTENIRGTLSDVRAHDFPWITAYEDDSFSADGELVTLYADQSNLCYHSPSPPFSYKGADYEGVHALVAQLGPTLVRGPRDAPNSYEGSNLLIPSVSYYLIRDGKGYSTPYYHGEEELGDLQFYTVSVVYSSPWRTALGELRWVYLISFLLAAALILALHTLMDRCLIRPIREVGEAMEREETRPSPPSEPPKTWREARLVQEGFAKYSGRLRKQADELTRLHTALDYARTAEENRRQMTSSIAHELKTPLAVIHSYAEGLKEHIAEDKRDKYIDVILSEVERTDGMVLEMLDLSRLEAGKVKLSREEFSLADLTRSIFEKLEMAAQAKELRIDFSFPSACTVTADEARIAQVIENFATNAIKYTPIGGRILVKILPWRLGTTFSIENDSTPLSPEALTKVWDTFYRTDPARSAGGTGLGLAIAKNIIDLHGGKCSVRNTETGVEFQFTI